MQTVSPADFRCVLDKKLSPTTIKKFAAEIGDVWGDACGRNRGIFVLDPPDGKTYGERQSTIHSVHSLCISRRCLTLIVEVLKERTTGVYSHLADCGRLPKTWGAPNVGSILTSDGETAYKYVLHPAFG